MKTFETFPERLTSIFSKSAEESVEMILKEELLIDNKCPNTLKKNLVVLGKKAEEFAEMIVLTNCPGILIEMFLRKDNFI